MAVFSIVDEPGIFECHVTLLVGMLVAAGILFFSGIRAQVCSNRQCGRLGDGGAMFLGFLMATLGLKLRMENVTHLSAWLAPVLILGVAIFDTTLVTMSRARRGLLPFATPGKDHAAHRLSNLGLGHRGAVV